MWTNTPTPEATNGGEATPPPTLTPAVARPPHAHVKARPGKPPWRTGDGAWQVTVTVQVLAANRDPLANVLVSAAWSGAVSGSVSCTTDNNGECSFTSEPISGHGNVTLRVLSLTYLDAGDAATHRDDASAEMGATSLTASPP